VSYRILLIDHDPDGLERIQRLLTEAGFEVVVASAAEEGMRTFERVRPDLLLIEALLPEKPGSELCREIKGTAQGKGMPVVLLLEEDEDKQARARALDPHDCDLLIERSIEKDELLALCEELLEKRQAQAEAMGDEDEGGQEEETGPPTEQSDEPVAADATDKNSAVRSPAAEENVLDAEGFADALTKLDTIIDEQETSTDRDESKAKKDEETSDAEKGGDFSYLSAEMTRAGVTDQPVAAGADRTAEPDKAPAEASNAESVAAEADQAKVGQPVAAAAQDEADSGQDISDRIDSLFSGGGPGEPTPAEKQVLSWTFDNGSLPADEGQSKIAAKPAHSASGVPSQESPEGPVDAADKFDNVVGWEETLPKTVQAPRDTADQAAPSKAAPAKPPTAPKSPSAAAHAVPAQTATFTRPSSPRRTLPRPDRRTITPQEPMSLKRWWLIAACVAVLAAGGSYVLFFRDGSSTEPVATGFEPRTTQPATRTPLVAQSSVPDRAESTEQPDEPLAATPLPIEEPLATASEQTRPALSRASPVPVKPQAAQPGRTVSGPVPEPERPERSAAASSPPREIKTPTRTAQKKPAAAKPTSPQPIATERMAAAPPAVASASPSTSAKPVTAKPEPKPAEPPRQVEPTPQQAATTPIEPEPKPVEPTRETAGAPVESAPKTTLPTPEVAAPVTTTTAAAETPVAQPEVPAATPVKLVRRTEPAYTSKSLKRARGDKIVLKLLINESGRVSRVLVDRGSPHKDLEAAAVGAVLSWQYEPATEGGVPVEAWTTAEFDF
jgi:TonB family protein